MWLCLTSDEQLSECEFESARARAILRMQLLEALGINGAQRKRGRCIKPLRATPLQDAAREAFAKPSVLATVNKGNTRQLGLQTRRCNHILYWLESGSQSST